MASDEAAAVDAVLEEKTVEDETPMAVTNVQTVELPSEITTSELPSDITTGELSSEVEIRTSELMSEITTADIPSEVTTDELPSVVITGELPTEVKTGELTAESTTGELPDEVTTGELPSEMTTGELPSEVTTGEVQSEVEVTTGELMSEITTLEIPSVSEDLTIEDVGEGEEGGEAADGGEEGEWGEVEDGYEEGEDEEEGYEVREEGEEAEEREEAVEGEGYEGREEEEDEWDEGEDEEDIEEAVESQESDKSVKSKLSVSRSTEGETTETRLTTEGEDEEEELGEEEEEEELTEEDEELKRLREYHTVILEQHKLLKIKNICLKKKLTKTFKKKKIDYALSEIKGTRDLQKRYRQKLLEFDEEEQIMMETMELIATKWELIREQTLLERVQLDEALEDLYERQRQIGANLIDVKTGKPINKKIVEDLIVQQTNLAAHMSQVRLCNIKLKNSVANKKAEIKLDHLGTDFHLMDYEQLCKDKEDYSDKIISRDMELKEVNQKAKEMKDFVDQVKTVSDNVQSMTDNQFYTLEQLDQKLIEARENINSLKERRHYTLEEIDRIKNNSGLLTHPDLLYDFEDTSKAVVEAKIQLETLRNISKNQKSNSRRLRKIVEKKKGRFSVIKAKEY